MNGLEISKTLRLDRYNFMHHDTPSELRDDKHCFKHTISYHNRTEVDFEVRDRIGASQTIHGTTHPSNHYCQHDLRHNLHLNRFMIMYTVEYAGADISKVLDYYRRMQNVSELYRRLYNEIDYTSKQKNILRHKQTAQVVIALNPNDLGVKDFSLTKESHPVYLEELGITVSLGGRMNNSLNAIDSVEDVIKARNNSASLSIANALDSSSTVVITANDKSGERHYDQLYISICEEVYKIPVECNSTLSTHGIIMRSHPSVEEMAADPTLKRTDFITRTYTFEEAFEKLGVATSIDEARNKGDSKRGLDLELTKKKHDLQIKDAALQNLQRDFRLEEENRKATLATLEFERIQHKAQLEEEGRLHKLEVDRLAQERTAEVNRLVNEAAKEKHARDMVLTEQRNFWDSVTSLLRNVGTFLGLAGGLNKLLFS